MSTPTPPSTPGSSPPPPASAHREIKLISHSSLFYWWPVWAFGFFMAAWTYFEDNRLTAVPPDATLAEQADLDGGVKAYALKTKLPLPKISAKAVETSKKAIPESGFPTRVSQHAWLGSLYVLILLIVVVITNVPMRGLWSFLVIILLVVVGLFITVFHGWDEIFERVANLRIYINLAGYLTLSTVIFVVWLLAMFVFDRRAYVIFTPGQIKVCEHIGDSVRTFDTMGVTFEKQRDDLFRHYILGFGSGDLILHTPRAQSHEIRMPNVLGIGWQLQAVENMLRERAITTA